MLGMPAARVRDLAREALGDLAPATAARVDPQWRGQIADYVLGQQTGPEATATRSHLGRSEPARAWAYSLLDSLGHLYPNGGMPEVPEAAGEPAPAAAPEPAAPPVAAAAPPVAAAPPRSEAGGRRPEGLSLPRRPPTPPKTNTPWRTRFDLCARLQSGAMLPARFDRWLVLMCRRVRLRRGSRTRGSWLCRWPWRGARARRWRRICARRSTWRIRSRSSTMCSRRASLLGRRARPART